MMDMERVNDYMARVSASEHTTFPPADGEMKVGLDLGTAYIVLVVLDNSTTAMTGHQPHPGTGKTMMGEVVAKVSIEKILEGIGVSRIVKADPLNLNEAVEAVREVMDEAGVRVVIFKSPCIAVTRPTARYHVTADSCTFCRQCIRELGCPAIVIEEGKAAIEPSLCSGCGICAQVCKFDAIQEVAHDE